MLPAISAPTNPHIKSLLKLKKPGASRREGRFMAEGLRVVQGLLAMGAAVQELLLRQGETEPEGIDHGLIRPVSAAVMDRLSSHASPPGVMAVVERPASVDPDPQRPALILHHLADPGNVGTLIRSARAFGIDQVLLIGGADPWTPKVLSATAGSLVGVQIAELPADAGPEALPEEANTVALVARDGADPKNVDLVSPWIVVGNEANGLPESWSQGARHRCTLPMAEGVESLNAAMAGSVACYALLYR